MPTPDVITDPPVAPPTDKPGITTTEFWVTVGTNIVNLLAAVLALLHPGFTVKPEVQVVVLAAAPVASGLSAAFYAMSRAHTKAATAEIVVQKMHLDQQEKREQRVWDIAVLSQPASTISSRSQAKKSEA